jgi:hypothetical protein
LASPGSVGEQMQEEQSQKEFDLSRLCTAWEDLDEAESLLVSVKFGDYGPRAEEFCDAAERVLRLACEIAGVPFPEEVPV